MVVSSICLIPVPGSADRISQPPHNPLLVPRLAAASTVATYWVFKSDKETRDYLSDRFGTIPPNATDGTPHVMQIIPAEIEAPELKQAISSLDDWQIHVLALLKWEYEKRMMFGVSEALLQDFFCLQVTIQHIILSKLWRAHFQQPMDDTGPERFNNLLSRLSYLLAMSLNAGGQEPHSAAAIKRC